MKRYFFVSLFGIMNPQHHVTTSLVPPILFWWNSPTIQAHGGALGKAFGILSSYWKLGKLSETLFIRGMVPLIGFLYFFCFIRQVRTCHWLVGNPEALLSSHIRSTPLNMLLTKFVARMDRWISKLGRKICRGAFLCNGQEVGRLYPSENTQVVVSSTIFRHEIFRRNTACTSDTIDLIFVGFLRPEKGLEFLLSALPPLNINQSWQLTIVGEFGVFVGYREKILKLIEDLRISENIRWMGYVPFGVKLFDLLKSTDILILPTLSEGTPRVLVEARAFGLPVIATRVGGIPTSVTDGYDGILVPPKSSVDITQAIENIVNHPHLRESLVSNGYDTVSKMTVENFVDEVADLASSLGKIT